MSKQVQEFHTNEKIHELSNGFDLDILLSFMPRYLSNFIWKSIKCVWEPDPKQTINPFEGLNIPGFLFSHKMSGIISAHDERSAASLATSNSNPNSRFKTPKVGINLINLFTCSNLLTESNKTFSTSKERIKASSITASCGLKWKVDLTSGMEQTKGFLIFTNRTICKIIIIHKIGTCNPRNLGWVS